MVRLRRSWQLILVQDSDSVLGGVIVEDPAIISNYHILKKPLVAQTEEKRLIDVHLTLFLGIGETVGNPSSEDSVATKIVEMAYHGGIVTSECSHQFTSGRLGIRPNTTQQFVFIYG